MENQDLAQRLLSGQANIDRMKRDVEQVVGTLSGLLDDDVEFFRRMSRGSRMLVNRVFENSQFSWVIVWRPVQTSRPIGFGCYYKKVTRQGYMESLVYENTCEDSHFLRLDMIPTVHRGLSFLLESVMNDNPAVAKALQPILVAADSELEAGEV